MTRRRKNARPTDDSGSILPLTAFFAFLSLVLIVVVAAATSLYLERTRLFSLADAAALVGAEAYDLTAVVPTPDGVLAPLESARVAEAAASYLAAQPTRIEALRLERAFTPDGTSAEVTLSGYWRPPILTLVLPEGVRLEVTATARSVFG